jgi:DNA-binding transcriptional MerR regulator
MEEYVSGQKASELLGVHQRTLYQWDKKKLIETIRTP